MIPAFEAIKVIQKHQGDSMVLPTVTGYRYWKAISNRPDLDITPPDSMGPASSMALGIAMAKRDKKILVLDGDGSILMNLGSLVTISGKAPENFVHFVFQDGQYFTTGGQPIPADGIVNLKGLADAAGYRATYEYSDLEQFANDLGNLLKKQGPLFICLKVYHVDNPLLTPL